jgi:fatty-acid peroxygenase
MGEAMDKIPKDNSFDSTFAFIKEGYSFIRNRCNELESDIFQTRMLLKKTICMKGEEAAIKFYDPSLFKREGVAPELVNATLFGKGGVQGLDGEGHRHRKNMFMSLVGRDRVQDLAIINKKHWDIYAEKWKGVERVRLFPQVQELIFRSVSEWAGVPVKEEEVSKRTRDIAAMIEGPGSLGKRHWKGRLARRESEKWIRGFVSDIRNLNTNAAENTALYIIATHRDLEGELLDEQVAAVEVLNVLRPSVAIARFITFAALALHEYPGERQKLQEDHDDEYLTYFVHEVRRFYPFFPFSAAEVVDDFNWNGYHFPKGTRVLLDLYGTNHDERLWENPDRFEPDRFRNWSYGAFNLIPQGGGSTHINHRCPGEGITIALMKIAIHYLTRSIEYDVPYQNLQVSLSRLPAKPNSGFIISKVRDRATETGTGQKGTVDEHSHSGEDRSSTKRETDRSGPKSEKDQSDRKSEMDIPGTNPQKDQSGPKSEKNQSGTQPDEDRTDKVDAGGEEDRPHRGQNESRGQKDS